MPLKPLDTYPAGGVDSRSNPVNMPPGRYLYVRDLWPQQDGSFRLRDGYSQYVAGLQANVPIYSITPVTGPGPNYKPLIVFWQNKTPYTLDPATLTITAPTVKGTAIASGARWSYFYTDGHLHAFNGTDAKWFDGVFWRDIGLPTLTAAQVAAISISLGKPGLTPPAVGGVNLAFASGGSWPATDTVGEYFYAAVLGLNGALSPWVQLGNGYRMLGSSGQQLNVTSLPTLTGGDILIFASTGDGDLNIQLLSVRGSGSSATALPGGACSQSGSTVTITSTGHGLTIGGSGYVVAGTFVLGIQSGNIPPTPITVPDANHLQISNWTGTNLNGAGATLYLVVSSITSSVSIADYQWTAPQPFSVAIPGSSSLPASTIGGTQPGYQYYASIYNSTTGHVGNRVAIGIRLAPQGPASPILHGLPTLSDSEWRLLIGRTSDGAQIPYAVIDSSGNWIITNSSSQATLALPFGLIDGNAELPSRNYPPPGTLDYNYQLSLLPGGAAQNPAVNATFSEAWVESDHCCGALAGLPTIYRSGSALDLREGKFVGLPEQSWDPADIETFPTAGAITGGQGYQGESWVFTHEDCAALMELAGETSWQGPWNVGLAGQFAWARGWQNMPFWVTGDKQLATVSGGGYLQMGGLMTTAAAGPIIVSDEYEAALLSQIGSAYLAQTEVVFIRKPLERVEVLRIHGRDSNGKPLTIIHDFNLRDQQSPYGQGYLEAFQGELGLAPAPTFAVIRDQNWQTQILAGAQDGKLYELYSGSSDNGTNFTGQALGLIYIGPERTAVKFLEWYGDQNAQFFIAKQLTTPFDPTQMQALCSSAPAEVQGDEDAQHWIVDIKDTPEMIHAYVLLQLTSHPADGSVGLNSPPHIPLESYGRVWMVTPLAGASRGK